MTVDLDIANWSYGAELEVGDVSRKSPIPPELGEWALTETDVVNIHGAMRGRACDPLGEEPAWGGEVNMAPVLGDPQAAGNRMRLILQHLYSIPGNNPSYTSLNASHVHVRVPGLRSDIKALKKLQQYVIDNQDFMIENTYMKDYVPPVWSKESRKAHTVPLDGKRKMQPWMNENIQKMASTPDEFFDLQMKGKDGVTNYRIFRYCVNTYNLRLIDTVEFRWFRASLSAVEWANMFLFCRRFMAEALMPVGSRPVSAWYHEYRYPPFIPHDEEMLKAWEKTRYTQDRFLKGHPRRQLREAK